MSTCSVAASYKPPMLVTRVRLPACALTRPAEAEHLGWRSTASCGYLPHAAYAPGKAEACPEPSSMSVHATCPSSRHPAVVARHSADFVASLRHVALHHSSIATSARSVAASYKPPHACDPGLTPGVRTYKACRG